MNTIRKGQVISRTRFGADGKETETAVYTYKADGSYTISNTDKNFGMTDLTYCDKAGKDNKNSFTGQIGKNLYLRCQRDIC